MCELQWQPEARQVWLPKEGGFCSLNWLVQSKNQRSNLWILPVYQPLSPFGQLRGTIIREIIWIWMGGLVFQLISWKTFIQALFGHFGAYYNSWFQEGWHMGKTRIHCIKSYPWCFRRLAETCRRQSIPFGTSPWTCQPTTGLEAKGGRRQPQPPRLVGQPSLSRTASRGSPNPSIWVPQPKLSAPHASHTRYEVKPGLG